MIISFLQKLKAKLELEKIYRELKLVSQDNFFHILIEKSPEKSLQDILSNLGPFYDELLGVKCFFHFPQSLLDIELFKLQENLDRVLNCKDSKGFVFLKVTYSYRTSSGSKIEVDSFFRIGQFYTRDYFL